jgi:glycosyltransferase involved in cell wall biosynthesis
VKIVFLLPGTGENPIGGFKIVYQYADGLAGRGHAVSVVHPSFIGSASTSFATRFRRHGLSYMKQKLAGSWRPDAWFTFSNNVRLLWTPAFNPTFIPKADVYVATWWLTAERLAAWKLPGRQLYLIQHYETWGGPTERVDATWRAPLEKIVIAKWLADIAAGFGERAHYIPNGLDFKQFGCDEAITDRNDSAIAMLSHASDWKGTADGIAALSLARDSVPGLTAEIFGVGEKPVGLPPWVKYHKRPAQSELRSIYNRAAIFLAPSWTEGWPLPPAEAMMCGAAVIATDIGGHREYCFDGDTAILAPAQNPAALAERIVRLCRDRAARMLIADQGHRYIQRFTWERALELFENALSVEHTRREIQLVGAEA